MTIAGLDIDLDSDWTEVGDSYLTSLAYEPREDVLASFDANRFPDFDVLPGGRPDWLMFSDGERHLRIANVDSTGLEKRLGVDLNYRHLEADTFVLVQYKRMVKEGGEWWYHGLECEGLLVLEVMVEGALRRLRCHEQSLDA